MYNYIVYKSWSYPDIPKGVWEEIDRVIHEKVSEEAIMSDAAQDMMVDECRKAIEQYS